MNELTTRTPCLNVCIPYKRVHKHVIYVRSSGYNDHGHVSVDVYINQS